MRKHAMAGAAVLLLAGCGTVSGSPVAAGSAGGAELFEPCDIPEDALRAVEVDPVNVGSTFLNGDDPQWDLCKWVGSWYFLTVLSTTHTIQEIESNPNNTDFGTVPVTNRDAVSYLSAIFPGGLMCDVAFPWEKGSVVIRIDTKTSETKREDPCAVAVRAANKLEADLPT